MMLILDTERLDIEVDAELDDLTGAANLEKLKALVLRDTVADNGDCNTNEKYYMLLLNVKNFTNFNARYGHHTGDELLQLTVQRISNHLRAVDTIIRFKNDHFIIIFDVESRPQFEKLIAKIKQILQQPFLTKKHEIPLSFQFILLIENKIDFNIDNVKQAFASQSSMAESMEHA